MINELVTRIVVSNSRGDKKKAVCTFFNVPPGDYHVDHLALWFYVLSFIETTRNALDVQSIQEVISNKTLEYHDKKKIIDVFLDLSSKFTTTSPPKTPPCDRKPGCVESILQSVVVSICDHSVSI